MPFPANTPESTPVINQVLHLFETGSPEIMAQVAPDIDFRIDHYRDETDVSWQSAKDIEGFGAVLTRLATDVFPSGTKILGVETQALGNNWFSTRFEQKFFYAQRGRMVESVTYITTHETDGKMDFFREIVTTITDI